MDEKYALRWLDLVVTTILDPAKTNISTIGSHELESFGSLMQQEITQNKTILSQAAFRIFSKRKIQRMVGQYHKSLFLLLETAFERHPQIAATSEKAMSLGKTAIEAINELLDFIEHRFGSTSIWTAGYRRLTLLASETASQKDLKNSPRGSMRQRRARRWQP